MQVDITSWRVCSGTEWDAGITSLPTAHLHPSRSETWNHLLSEHQLLGTLILSCHWRHLSATHFENFVTYFPRHFIICCRFWASLVRRQHRWQVESMGGTEWCIFRFRNVLSLHQSDWNEGHGSRCKLLLVPRLLRESLLRMQVCLIQTWSGCLWASRIHLETSADTNERAKQEKKCHYHYYRSSGQSPLGAGWKYTEKPA
jgi:hypothetical protein